MKQTKHILLLAALLFCSLAVSAHDFEVDGIYYNITSSTDLTVEVTFRGNKPSSYEEEISLIKNFIANRGKWMDSNIDSLKKWAS